MIHVLDSQKVTQHASTSCKGAKTDKFNFGQHKAKHDLTNKALQRTDWAAFDDDTAKSRWRQLLSLRKMIHVLDSQKVMPTCKHKLQRSQDR